MMLILIYYTFCVILVYLDLEIWIKFFVEVLSMSALQHTYALMLNVPLCSSIYGI